MAMAAPTPTIRSTCLGILLALGVVAPAVCAQTVIGIFGGIDLTDLSGDAPDNANYTPDVGFAVGAVGELRIVPDVWLSVQPTWIQRGSRIAFAVLGEEELNDSLGLNANYASVPILLKIVSNNGKTYVTGGVDLGFLLNATISGAGDPVDVSHTFRNIDLSADFALGIMLPVGKPRITIEARYSQSILNTAHPDQSPEVYSLPPRFRWSGIQLFAGFLYPLGEDD